MSYSITAAAKFQPQDVVPVSANPAYEQVTSIALQENSAYSIVHTVSPPAAAAAEYENIGDRKHGNDKLSESTILCVSLIWVCLIYIYSSN